MGIFFFGRPKRCPMYSSKKIVNIKLSECNSGSFCLNIIKSDKPLPRLIRKKERSVKILKSEIKD